MENKKIESFNYVYSAKEQDEIKSIRNKYTSSLEEDKMTQLRRLDRSVTQKASSISIAIGVIGALILGTGMSLTMSEFSIILGMYKDMAMLIGIILGLFGIAFISLSYPIYNRIVKKERKKIAPEIIRLTDELIK